MSLTEIARKVGLSTSSISDIKRGASKAPRGMAAVRLHKLHEKSAASEQRQGSR